MVKRRRLEAPSNADLSKIEEEFRGETVGRPIGLRGVAPIAQVAAEAAARLQPDDAEARARRARIEADAARLNSAREEGLLIVELGLDEIDENAMIRDRMALNEEAIQEMRQSIAAHGLRLPIEVFELERPGKNDERYGLLSGYRRLLAVRGLLEMTGAEKYRTIRALIRPRASSGGAFVSMVEENEVREELTPFERGRIAVIAANQGAFANTEEAVERLFASGSKAKRSKIRSFALIFEELGDMLQFPEGLTERRGLQLSSALRRGAEARLREALSRQGAQDAEGEWSLLEPVLQTLDAPDGEQRRAGRPKSAPRPGYMWLDDRTLRTTTGVNIRRATDGRSHILRLEGGDITEEFMDDLMQQIRSLLES